MAKAKVTMTCTTCGTTYDVSRILRNRDAADSWENWMKNQEGTCPECYAAEMAAKRAAEREAANAAAAQQSKEAGMAPLQGSEKQIVWAETLRIRLYNNIRSNASFCVYRGQSITAETAPAVAAEVDAFFASQTSAKFYIDCRDASPQRVLNLIAASVPAVETKEISVKIYTFTGMEIPGEHTAVKTANVYTITLKNGKTLTFDATTLVQINANNARFANRMELK